MKSYAYALALGIVLGFASVMSLPLPAKAFPLVSRETVAAQAVKQSVTKKIWYGGGWHHGGYGWRGGYGYYHGYGWHHGYGWRGGWGGVCTMRCNPWHCWRACW